MSSSHAPHMLWPVGRRDHLQYLDPEVTIVHLLITASVGVCLNAHAFFFENIPEQEHGTSTPRWYF
jgi:hypothetical protein